MMAFLDTFVCVHKEESWTHQTKHFKSKSREQRSGIERQGASRNRGRDALAGSLGIESGETTRREREPGVLLAEAVSPPLPFSIIFQLQVGLPCISAAGPAI